MYSRQYGTLKYGNKQATYEAELRENEKVLVLPWEHCAERVVTNNY